MKRISRTIRDPIRDAVRDALRDSRHDLATRLDRTLGGDLGRRARRLARSSMASAAAVPGFLARAAGGRHRPAGLAAGSGVRWLAGAAVLAAGAALLNWRAARAAEARHPPRGVFIDVDGVQLHVKEAGSGPPVLLLHGNGAMASDFDGAGLFVRLSATHRVVAIDRPGFGYSDRPRGRSWSSAAQAALIARAIDRLGLDRPVVVAHSWGTLVALALALEHPARVAGLVLASGYYFPTFRLDALLLGSPAIPVLGDLMRWTVSPLLSRALLPRLRRRIFAPQPVSPHFLTAVPREMMVRPSQLHAAASESATMVREAARLAPHYGRLRVPTVILAGDGDRLVDPYRQSARLAEVLPIAELRLLSLVGHMLHYEAPDEVVSAVEAVSRMPAPALRGEGTRRDRIGGDGPQPATAQSATAQEAARRSPATVAKVGAATTAPSPDRGGAMPAR